MIKNILAVISGIIVGNIAIMGLHYVGMIFYPLPEGIDINDMKAIAEYIGIAPIGSLFFVMFAHIGGAFIAGIATALIDKNRITAYIVGGFFTLTGAYNLYVFPHPLWFNIEVILYLPAAYFGFKLANRNN